MPKWRVPFTFEAEGDVEVDEETAEAAEKAVRAMRARELLDYADFHEVDIEKRRITMLEEDDDV